MEMSSIQNLLGKLSSSLNLSTNYKLETSFFEDYSEVTVRSAEGTLLLNFVVGLDEVTCLFGGSLYQPIETSYSYLNWSELLWVLISFLFPIYSSDVPLPTFLSAIAGRTTRSWAAFLGTLIEGLSLSSSLDGNILTIDGDMIIVEPREVQYRGDVDCNFDYNNSYELLKNLLSLLAHILSSRDLDITLWDVLDDESLLEEEPQDAGSSAPSFDNSMDLDVSLPSGDLEGGESEASAEDEAPSSVGETLE